MPEVLVKHYLHNGQFAEVLDSETVHNGRRVLSISGPLELDVERDATAMEEIANSIYKVLNDVRQAKKELARIAAKAAINAEASAA